MVSPTELQLMQTSQRKVIPGQKPYGRVIESSAPRQAAVMTVAEQETEVPAQTPQREYEIISTSSGVPRFVKYTEGGVVRQEPLYTIKQDIEGRVEYVQNPNIPKDISSQISLTLPESYRRWELRDQTVEYGSYREPAVVMREGQAMINPQLPADIRSQLTLETRPTTTTTAPEQRITLDQPTSRPLKTKPESTITFPLYEAGEAAGKWYEENIGKPVGELIYSGVEKLQSVVEVLPELRIGGYSSRETMKENIAAVGGVYVGATKAPASLVRYGSIIPPAIEYTARVAVEEPERLGIAIAGGAGITITGLQQAFTERPFETVGEMAVVAAIGSKIPVGKFVKYGYERLPIRPSIGTATLPKSSYTAFGITRKAGQVETFRPIVSMGRIEGKRMPRFSAGTPKVAESEFISGRQYLPITPYETAIVTKFTGPESVRITSALGTRRITTRGESIYLREARPEIDVVVKQLGLPQRRAVGSVIEQTLAETGSVLYGSPIQRGVGREYGIRAIGRKIGDIDIRAPEPELAKQLLTERINIAAGGRVVKVDDGIKVIKTGKKLADVLEPEVQPDLAIIGGAGKTTGPEYVTYGILREPLGKTREGIYTISFGEQVSRKLQGALSISEKERTVISEAGEVVTGKITPRHEGRVKDIMDYYFGERFNIERMERTGGIQAIRAGKASKQLEKFLGTYGPEISTAIREKYSGLPKITVKERVIYKPRTVEEIFAQKSPVVESGRIKSVSPISKSQIPGLSEVSSQISSPSRMPSISQISSSMISGYEPIKTGRPSYSISQIMEQDRIEPKYGFVGYPPEIPSMIFVSPPITPGYSISPPIPPYQPPSSIIREYPPYFPTIFPPDEPPKKKSGKLRKLSKEYKESDIFISPFDEKRIKKLFTERIVFF